MSHTEKNFCVHRILPVFWKNSLLICCPLLAVLFSTAAAPFTDASTDELEARGYTNIPTEAQVVLSGEDILGGHGVSVVYQTQGPWDYSGYLSFEYQCAAGGCFQCIEFVLWLYDQQLGYPYQWPGAIWSPYQLIGLAQVANQLTYQLETGLISIQDAQYRLYENYIDLRYYPNGSTVAPQPGDILISADGGHSMLVNRVGGDQLEIVQQNAWEITADPQPSALEMRQVYISGGGYSVQNSLGWIHSPRWEEVLTLGGSQQTVGIGLRWTRAADALTLYLPAAAINTLAADASGTIIAVMVADLADAGVLQLTSTAYIDCALRALQNNPAAINENAVEVTIPYFGNALIVQAAGTQSASAPLEIPVVSCGWNG
jgi:hypothetical protein